MECHDRKPALTRRYGRARLGTQGSRLAKTEESSLVTTKNMIYVPLYYKHLEVHHHKSNLYIKREAQAARQQPNKN